MAQVGLPITMRILLFGLCQISHRLTFVTVMILTFAFGKISGQWEEYALQNQYAFLLVGISGVNYLWALWLCTVSTGGHARNPGMQNPPLGEDFLQSRCTSGWRSYLLEGPR